LNGPETAGSACADDSRTGLAEPGGNTSAGAASGTCNYSYPPAQGIAIVRKLHGVNISD
jgi:hypothetical protein